MPTQFESDQHAMRYALEIARRGLGNVEPNPAVGALVVAPDRTLVSEGWHREFGGPHAEVHAIQAAGNDLAGNDLFVTLEPCSHHGQTPPCVDLVLQHQFRRVVIGCSDPAAHVNGQGIAQLRENGVDVVEGICGAEAARLIAPFRTLQLNGRPWVHAKWAMTMDGRIASRTGHSKWISNERSREYVHQLRGRMDVILTGRGTVVADNPLLTARPEGARRPLRAVLDSTGESLTNDSQLLRTANEVPVAVFATAHCTDAEQARLQRAGVECIVVDADGRGRPDVDAVLLELGRRRCTNLLVESGPGILGALFDSEKVDELHVFVAPKIVGGVKALSPVGGLGRANIPELPNLQNVRTRDFEGDVLIQADVSRG